MSEQKKKNNVVVLIIIIVLVAAIGGYAIWQSQSKTNSGSSKNTVTTTTAQATTTTENQEVMFINKEITLKVGDTNTLLVNAPENSELKWSSSDTSVVTVENGNIKGIAKGTATITVQLGSSTDTCAVTVKEKKKPTTTANKYEKYLGKWHGEVSSSSGGWLGVDLNINNLTDSVCSGKITIDGTEYNISASYEYGAYNATISTEYSVKINIDDSLKIKTVVEMYSNYVLYDTYIGNLYSSN